MPFHYHEWATSSKHSPLQGWLTGKERRPTSHVAPIYVEEGVVHYCVTNMPAAVARTSAFALNNATLPFVTALADQGCREALKFDGNLRNGLNVYRGSITHEAVAEALDADYVPAREVVGF